MKKSDLIQILQERAEISKDKSTLVVKTILDEISNSLTKGQRVEIRNFGNFTVRIRKAHEGRNPKTGEKVMVPDRKAPHFKPGLELQNRVKGDQ